MMMMKTCQTMFICILMLQVLGVNGQYNKTRGQCMYRRNRLGFECDDGQCIEKGDICDGRKDCDDGSDEGSFCCETSCQTETGLSVCIPNDGYNYTETVCRDCTKGGYPGFRCNDGACIYRRKVCDGRFQCRDGSDEAYCDTKCVTQEGLKVSAPRDLMVPGHCRQCDFNTLGDGFRCDNAQCILAAWVCDETSECQDGSDESDETCNPQLETEDEDSFDAFHTKNTADTVVDTKKTEVTENTAYTENTTAFVGTEDTTVYDVETDIAANVTTVNDPKYDTGDSTPDDPSECPQSWTCQKYSDCATFDNFLEAGGLFRDLRCQPRNLSWICCDPEGFYEGKIPDTLG